MSARVGVIGSNNVDLVTYAGRIPEAGETLAASHFEMNAGGKGANQAAAAAKLGSEVVMVSCVGDDLFGQGTRQNLCGLGIDTRPVRTVPGVANGTATILVEPSGENRILIAPGANDALGPEDIDAAAETLRGCALLLLQLEVRLETVYHAVAWARANAVPVLLNPAPASGALSLPHIAGIDFLAPNQTELAILTGLPTETAADSEVAAHSLLERGIGSVIVTLGAAGALLVQRGGTLAIAPVAVVARDTTGAGDAFIGAFAHHYACGHDIADALRLAAHYAAYSVTRAGAQKSFATKDEFAAFRKQMAQSAAQGTA